jgi:hypothetical protein
MKWVRTPACLTWRWNIAPGGSLADQLDGTPWPPVKAAALAETLARAVHAAHRANVVHRDLKPANVLLAAEGQPKVTDFGLAKKLDEAVRTKSGEFMGTASYMPPEQAGGKSKEAGPAADVYALGAILYELLTGRPPFKGADWLDTVMQVLSQEPVAVRRLQAKVPRDLETICLKCLEKNPTRRFASAQALADDLRRFLAGQPITARPAGAVERAVKLVRRNPAVAGLLAVVLLVFAVGAVVSNLYALEARRQAADARSSAAQAEENERQAKHIADELEVTLMDGLLGSIGQQEGEPGPAESGPLGKLANLSNERKLRFIELGLQQPETARSLARRAGWVVQAAGGLDAARRQQVEQVVMTSSGPGECRRRRRRHMFHWQRPWKSGTPSFGNWRWKRWFLQSRPPTRRLSPGCPAGYRHSASGLAAVGGRLDAAQAGKTTEVLIATMAKTTDPDALNALAQGLTAVVGRLEAAPAAKAAEILLATIAKTANRGMPSTSCRRVWGQCPVAWRRRRRAPWPRPSSPPWPSPLAPMTSAPWRRCSGRSASACQRRRS